jgi:hypothetical protein
MTKARVSVILIAAWLGTGLVLIYVANVPPWLWLIGNVAGAVVIGNYSRSFPDGALSRGEKVLRIGAYAIVGTVAAVFALLLAVTMLAFLVAWLAKSTWGVGVVL